jgi:hypothetical protein
MRRRALHVGCRLVLAQTLINHLPQQIVGIGEVSNIDKVLLEIEDTLAERLGVAVDVTSGITRKLPPRKPKVKM